MSLSGGARVRHERLARGWSQDELARRVGVRQATISRIERDSVSNLPSRSTMTRLGAVFALPIAVLFPYEDTDHFAPLAATG